MSSFNFQIPAGEVPVCKTGKVHVHPFDAARFMQRSCVVENSKVKMKTVGRYAFKLRIKPEAVEEYEREHKRVWPELLAKLKDVGISDYSIFRRGQELFLCLRVDDFEKAWDELDRDPVNQRWQQFMSPLFEPVPDLQNGERFAMMEEVFHLE